jgi:quinol monooxygenase YgiN
MAGVVSLPAEASAGGLSLHNAPPTSEGEPPMADINTLKKGLIVTAFWEAKPSEVDALVGIIKKFLPQAQAEPGVLAFQIHQSTTEPTKFFFYEVFRDEAAFAYHSEAKHFKSLILEQAVPKLAKRERTQHRFV